LVQAVKRIYIDVTGGRLCCVDFGGQGMAALLLHGLAGRANEWRDTASWLKQHHRVLAMDQRGHGRSDRPPGEYSRDAYVDDVLEIIRRLDLAPVTLIGQSMGGLNALLCAARAPDLVSRLIVIEATPAPNPTVQVDVARWLDSWPVPFPSLADARAFFGGNTLYAETWIEVLQEADDGYWPQFNKDAMVESMADVVSQDYWSEWDTITCPVLVVGGGKSSVEKEQLRAMASRVRDGECVVIPEAGHDLHLERPEDWRLAAQAFLHKVGAR
jgi:pimeloyl-ACP methyl ester carboxylesterase